MAQKEKPKAKRKTNKVAPKKDISSNPNQKKVLDIMVANGGSFRRAMLKAGYSEAYAKNPKKFRKTATWQQLLEENLPDWLLTEKHLELLDAKTIDNYIFPLSMDDEQITALVEHWGFSIVSIVHGDTNNRAYFSAPDNQIILKAVQEGYKIKNKYEPSEDTLIIRRYEDLSDEDLARIYSAKLNRDTEKTND